MSFAAVIERLQKLENPYPGLRPFETEESHLFFGRDRQTAELVGRLERNRFVAVLGVSGSGKSSLVRAGLVPALERGRVSEAGQRWRMVVARPAGAPFESLAAALSDAGLDGSPLKTSSFGLIEVARQLAPDETLLVVIDQFEELFRYKDLASRAASARQDAAAADAAEFVQILLAAIRHQPPIYVVLTMRSEYLGDCAEFRDLPETLNDCQYLVPRLTREQRREAIEGPLGSLGIAPSLVQRMLNDAGDEPDQLPILQHALMRTWSHWRRTDPDRKRRIELQDYDAIGGFDGALNQQADELLGRVPQGIAATIFKRLTARGRNNRERRDPATLANLWALCSAETAEARGQVNAVIDVFRLDEATFLTPRRGAIQPDAYIDITHESLIRQWKKLSNEWLPEEQRSATTFLDLIARANNWKARKGELLIGLDFNDAAAWDRQRNRSTAWAEHYAGADDLQNVVDLIRASEVKERQRRWRAKRNLSIAIALSLLFAVLGGVAWYQARQATQLRKDSLVRQLAAQSDALQNEQLNLEPAVILAIESLSRGATPEGDHALRGAAERLPHRISSVQHGGPVRSVAFSPDGRRVASASEDGIARVLEAADGKPVSQLAYGQAVTSIAFSPDGRLVAAGSEDGTGRVFEATTGREVARATHDGTVVSVAFSPDGRLVASGSEDMTVRVFEAVGAREITSLTYDAAITSLAFSPDGRSLAIGSSGSTAVFNPANAREIRKYPQNEAAAAIVFSRDGHWLATGNADSNVRVLDVATGREVSHLTHQAAITSVAFSPDGRWVASASDDKTARVFEAGSGKEISRLTFQEAVGSVTFSGDGRLVAAASDDTTARVFDAATGKEVARLAHGGEVVSVAFSGDGRLLASGSWDRTARVFDMSRTNELARFPHGGAVLSLALSADERLVAVGGADQISDVFASTAAHTPGTPSTWTRILTIPNDGSVGSVALSADQRRLATASSDMVARVFDIAGPKEISRAVHEGAVSSVGFSPDGRWLATGSWDRMARVVDVASGVEISRLMHDGNVTSAVFSADGRKVATGSEDMTARVFDAASGKEVSRMTHNGKVAWAAFSPDGRLVATGSEDTTARVFEADTGRQVSSITHQRPVRFVTFSADGRLVASGSEDRTARVFEAATGRELFRLLLDGRVLETRFSEQGRYLLTLSLTPGGNQVVLTRHLLSPVDLIADACSRLTRSLTDSEWKEYLGVETPHRCPNLH